MDLRVVVLLVGTCHCIDAALLFRMSPNTTRKDSVIRWSEWRWGNADGFSLVDKVAEPKKCPTLSFSVQVSPQDLNRCNSLIRPPLRSQPSFGLEPCQGGSSSNANMYAKIAAKVEHVYYLCIDCATVKIPGIIAQDKVSMVRAGEIDTCLKSTKKCHGFAVTKVHKLIIAHAKSQGYDSVAVFEEDFRTPPGCTRLLTDEGVLLSYLDSNFAGIVRLSWAFSHGFNNTHPFTECPQECRCKKTNDVICQTSPGCPHMSSAAGYVIKSTGYDAILTSPGVIDLTNFASKVSNVILRPIGYELGKEGRMNDWVHFRDKCLRG